MSQDQDQKQLKLLQERLFNAYSLPVEIQQQWHKQIDELENQANALKTKLNIKFDRNKANEMLIQTINEIIQEAKGDYGNGEFKKFLDKNPDLRKLWESDCIVDVAFRLEDMEYVEKCLEQYKKNMLEVDRLYSKEVQF